VRLTAPVIVQHSATLEEGARIIGPTTIGPGVRIRRGALVARSLLGPGAVVDPGAVVCQQVTFGRYRLRASGVATTGSQASTRSVVVGEGPAQERVPDRVDSKRERRRGFHLLAKRLLDVTSAALGLLLLSPVFAAVAISIKLTSPGPVFFIHRRERKGGKEFPCIKFRTMAADAHAQQRELYQQNQLDGPQFKMENDPRETPVGRWLRSRNIDELPQLINVLLGHMGLVGPRPSPFRENQICVPWRRARLSVQPGITGLWQLCRDRRVEGDFHQWIYYDMAYVRNFSIWLDLKIMFHTLVTKGGRRSVPLSRFIRSAEDQDDAHTVEPSTAKTTTESVSLS
jgi:lipopolysaccharide/colanic/teichoic acid biosynthesis glycosyltransferase